MNKTDLIKAEKYRAAVEAIVNSGDKPFIAMQRFNDILNIQPKEKDIKVRNGYKYIPIGILEARLDQFFFGNWSIENFTYQREFNEMVGSLDLIVVNPITGDKIRRVGAGSIQIMQDKDSTIAQFNDTKKKNALEMGFPKLKAECFRNSVKGLGNIFGRNLNRDMYENPIGMIKEEVIELNAKPEDIETDES